MIYVVAHNFMVESNRIEGIHRAPSEQEIAATLDFVNSDTMSVTRLKALVGDYQPNARIRDKPGLDVRVGPHTPPPGGPQIVSDLQTLLNGIEVGHWDPYEAHCRYETLHPFTDGNGRSGRSLWAWHMQRRGEGFPTIGFLHLWYYQSLQHSRVDTHSQCTKTQQDA